MDDFLGSGWSLTGTSARITRGEERIREAIRTILGTSPGERVMRPDFGCRIHDLVFDPNDPSTAGAVASAVDDALSIWEPRIDVLDVATITDPAEPNRLLVEISYRVRSTNSRANVVYPFSVR